MPEPTVGIGKDIRNSDPALTEYTKLTYLKWGQKKGEIQGLVHFQIEKHPHL